MWNKNAFPVSVFYVAEIQAGKVGRDSTILVVAEQLPRIRFFFYLSKLPLATAVQNGRVQKKCGLH